jgi:hypothetical protein
MLSLSHTWKQFATWTRGEHGQTSQPIDCCFEGHLHCPLHTKESTSRFNARTSVIDRTAKLESEAFPHLQIFRFLSLDQRFRHVVVCLVKRFKVEIAGNH